MNRFAAPLAVAAIFAASLGFTAPATATETAPSAQIAVEAPAATLTFEKPSVTTTPAPVVKPQSKAPVTRSVTPAPKMKAPTPKAAPLPQKPTEPPVRCEEDMPCWDCSTMGNKICGPQVPTEVLTWTPEDREIPSSVWNTQWQWNADGTPRQ